MNGKTTFALVVFAALACGREAPPRERTSLPGTGSGDPAPGYAALGSEASEVAAADFASASSSPLAAFPLLQDTARTVTRRIWAEADLYDIAPDGRLAVQTDWTTGDLAIRDMDSGEVRHLTRNKGRFDPGEAEDARFSRDGRRVAYTWYDEAQPAFYKLGVVDIDGTNPRLIYQDRFTTWISAEDWSPDGEYVLASRSVAGKDASELLLISATDGDARLIRDFPDPATGGSGGMRFSPDGRFIAYHGWRDDPEDNDIFVIDVATGEEHSLVVDPANDEMLGWAPDGEHILFRSDRSGTPGAWLLPVTDGRANGRPWLVKPDMWRTVGVRFSQDGRYYYRVSTRSRDVYVVGFDPATKSVIGSPSVVSARTAPSSGSGIWSPDGRHLAYIDSNGPLNRVVVRSMESGNARHLELGEPGSTGTLGWTADGRAVVVWVSNPSDEDNRLALFQIDVQTGRKTALTDPRQSIPFVYPRLAAENDFLVYQVSEENSDGKVAFHILRYDLASGDSTVLFRTPYGAWGQILGAALSPDGETLAFGYSPVVGSDPHSLILLPITGEEPRELPIEGARGIAWMPDGDAMLFNRFVEVGPIWDTWYVDLSGGEPQPIGLTTHGTVVALDVHPDGQQLTYTSTVGGSELWVMENFLPGTRLGERAGPVR